MGERPRETIGSMAWAAIVELHGDNAKLGRWLGVGARTVDNWAKGISRPPWERREKIRRMGKRLGALIEPHAWDAPVGLGS